MTTFKSNRTKAGIKVNQGSRILQRVQIPHTIKQARPAEEITKSFGIQKPANCPNAPKTSKRPVKVRNFFKPYLSNSVTILLENKQESP